MICRPDRDVFLALELDQVGRRQRVLAGVVELHAAIADHELIGLQIGRLQRRLDLGRIGRAGAVDRVGQHQKALHPARAGVVEIAAVFVLEHLVDLVAVAARLADIPGAAVHRALGELADVGNEARIGEAGIVADDHRRQVVEILHRLEIQDGVRGIADEDHRVGLLAS